MNVQLGPCPWCGGEPWFAEVKSLAGGVLYRAECPKCRLHLRAYKTMQEAIEQWNKRAEDKE